MTDPYAEHCALGTNGREPTEFVVQRSCFTDGAVAVRVSPYGGVFDPDDLIAAIRAASN